MNPRNKPACPDCDWSLDRRDFLRMTGAAAAIGAAAPGLLFPHVAAAAPSAKSAAETAAGAHGVVHSGR